MSEEWRILAEYPAYAVSNLGRVKRVVPDANNHRCRVLKPWLNNKGYELVNLACGGRTRAKTVHRLVCSTFNGSAPSARHEVAHNDGDPRNNRAENLRWATRAENMADCVKHGTKAVGERHGRTTKPEATPRGEAHGHAKLTEADVIAIRASTDTGRATAKRFGISPAAVCVIRGRKTWKHVA